MSGKRVLALLAVLVGVGGIAALFVTYKSAREQIRDTYPLASQSEDGRALEFRTDEATTVVVRRILDTSRPAQTVYQPAAVFMRFQDDVVAVAPADGGGTVLYVDEASRGYRRWFPYVGAFWAVNAARGAGGSAFRGGGPGGGGK